MVAFCDGHKGQEQCKSAYGKCVWDPFGGSCGVWTAGDSGECVISTSKCTDLPGELGWKGQLRPWTTEGKKKDLKDSDFGSSLKITTSGDTLKKKPPLCKKTPP